MDNRSIKNKQFAIFTLLIALVFVVCFGVYEKFSDREDIVVSSQTVSNLYTRSFIETTDYGNWNVYAMWYDPVGNPSINITDDDTLLTYTPINNDLYQQFSAYIGFEGDYDSPAINPGDMVIKVPINVYGYNSPYTLSDDGSVIYVTDNNLNKIIAQLQFDDFNIHNVSTCADYDEFCWEIVDNELLINVNTAIVNGNLDTGSGIFLYYTVYPSLMSVDNQADSFKVTFKNENEKDFAKIALAVNHTINFESNEFSFINPITLQGMGYWNYNIWGDNPYEDDEEAVFVEYIVKGAVNSTGKFTLSTEYESNNGQVVLFSTNGKNYNLVDDDSLLNDYGDVISKTIVFPEVSESYEYHFVVMYNINDQLDFEFTINADGAKKIFKKEIFNGSYTNKTFTFERESTSDADITVPVYPNGNANNLNVSITNSDASTGAINKLKNATNLEYEWLVEPTGESINKNTSGKIVKAFNNFNNTNEGANSYTIDFGTNGMYYDSSYNTDSNLIKLTNSNYVIKNMTLIDDIEYDYQVSGKTYLLNEVTDYSTYSTKEIYAKISNNNWEKIGSYVKTDDGIEFTSAYTGTTFDSTTNTITLPNNVTEVKITYTGTRAAIYAGFKYVTKIASDSSLINNINNLTNAGLDFVIKSSANVSINNEVQNEKKAGTILTEFKSSSVLDVNSSIVKEGSTDIVTYNINYYDYLNSGSLDTSEVEDYVTSQDKGKFYILIPKGITYDELIVYDVDGNVISNSNYTVNSTDNYYDNRSLVTITVNKNNNKSIVGSSVKSGYSVRMIVKYSKLDNIKYKNELYLNVAYLGSNMGSGKKSFDDYSSSTDAVKNQFKESIQLDDTYNTLLYKTNTVTLEQAFIVNGRLSSGIKDASSTEYSNEISIREGSKYVYKSEYIFGDSLEEVNNAKLFNIFTNGDSSFNGIFDSIDTSYLDDNGLNYDVYYTVNKNIDLSNSMYTDLSDNTIWTKIEPTDKSSITGVVVNITSKMSGDDNITPVVYVTMIAPKANGTNLVSKNIVTLIYNDGTADKKISSPETSVLLLENSLSGSIVTKENESGEEISGTNSLPGSFGYNIELSNSENVKYNNVVAEITIPSSVILNEDDIVLSINGVETRKATYTVNGNKVIVTVSEMDNKGLSIWVPVSIDVSKISNDVNELSASLLVSSVNGIDLDNNVITIKNNLSVPSISYGKYVDTEDTAIYSEAITPVLITPGETYSYMIELKNTSNVSAYNVKVVDNVPNGVIVKNISNDGVYNSSNRTITWNISELKPLEIKSLEYSVSVSNDIPLKTMYSSYGHVTLVNPLDSRYNLVDNDTNTVNVIYQVASDIKVSNTLIGTLADKNKEFTYNVSLTGSSSDAGDYNIIDNSGKTIKAITLNGDGEGSATIKLKGSESFTIKLLPSGVDYTISQNDEEGYITKLVGKTENNIIGTTNEERVVNYTFSNSYDVSTSVSFNAFVRYSNGVDSESFEFVLTDIDDNVIEHINNDSTGKVAFNSINYDNVSGLVQYKLYQVSGTNKQILYDNNVYTINVNLVNDGKGNLNSSVKYYNKNNELVDTMSFVNEYVPTGFVIGNSNISEYVNPTKKFKYNLYLKADVNSTYNILDSKNNIIDTITTDDESEANYEFELTSDDQIIISDLPIGTIYRISQFNEDYYSSTINASYSVDNENNTIVSSGEISEGTTKVIYNNKYSTVASYAPSVNVNYEDALLEEDSFDFLITDISEGSSNGYSELVSNDVNGKLSFKSIKYTVPGEYKYVITQIKGDDNHTIYDTTKCYLTMLLSDNGDGTMSYTYSYKFDNGLSGFVNKYSVEEVNKEEVITPEEAEIIDETNKHFINPNTGVFGKILIFVAIGITAIVLLITRKSIKLKKFE